MVQFFISGMLAMFAERRGSIRALARAMAGEGETDLEATVCRWLTMARSEPRPIGDLNRILTRVSKFSRSEIKKVRRRIHAEPGPAGDRQAIVACLSLLWGAKKPVVLAPEEALTLPAVLGALAGLAAFVCQAMRGILVASPRAAT